MSKKDFLGYWRLTETDLWDQDALDMIEPAHISFGESSTLGMIAISAGLDCKYEDNRVEFSLLGDDDGSLLVGRGWAEIDDAGTLNGMLFFHDGDESGFTLSERSSQPSVPSRNRVAGGGGNGAAVQATSTSGSWGSRDQPVT